METTLAPGTIIMLCFIAALFVFSCYLVWLNIKNSEEAGEEHE